MKETQQHNGREGFVSDFSNSILKRVEAATPVVLLSDSDDKSVEVVQDAVGQHFVRRTYSPDALRDVERYGLRFQDALAGMQRDFSRAGLEMTPHFIANPQRDEGQPLIVVSEYLQDAKPVLEAATDTKIALARGLGNLVSSGQEILLQKQMLREDMFHVIRKPNGEETALLTDIDPYVLPLDLLAMNSYLKDSMTGIYIDRVSELFYDDWTEIEEMSQVLTAFAQGVSPILAKEPGDVTMRAFGDLQMMRYGMDQR